VHNFQLEQIGKLLRWGSSRVGRGMFEEEGGGRGGEREL
jgi:hypothetical protein